jgi:hypothetical protein
MERAEDRSRFGATHQPREKDESLIDPLRHHEASTSQALEEQKNGGRCGPRFRHAPSPADPPREQHAQRSSDDLSRRSATSIEQRGARRETRAAVKRLPRTPYPRTSFSTGSASQA